MTSTGANLRRRSTAPATAQPQEGAIAPGSGDVESAVRRDLEQLGRRAPWLAESGLAASCVALAQGIDNAGNSLTSKAMAARALREAYDRLLELAPEEKTSDAIDALGAKADAKLAR
jgi:hypothetical protein